MKHVICFYFIISFQLLIGQTLPICGTDKVMEKYRDSNFFKLKQVEATQLKKHQFNTKIIPLVFHIIHNGNPIGVDENISEEQINDAVNILNEDFNILNSDLDNVVESFQNLIGDGNIEFRLAKLDPNGNCTNGINRIISESTNQANDCVKEIVSWDDTKYVNIWVVEDIDNEIGAAAYTYLPGSLWGDEVEGIIINHEYVGSIGASNNTPYKRHTLTHEFGHFFNLEHTWGWGSNGDIDNCSFDDGVSDTPNTIGAYSTCNVSQESCGNLDNIQNFMDYSSCTCMFTSGQIVRMQNCLNSSVSSRNNLWSNSNLWETGTHDDYDAEDCIPNVDFFVSKPNRICLTSPVTLINNTHNNGQNPIYAWSFVGADIDFSSEENPTVIYNDPGEYQITLNVISDAGENSVTKTYDIYTPAMNLNEDFINTQFPVNIDPSLSWSIDAPANETSWTRTPVSSTSTTGSVKIRSRYFDCYNKHYLYTPNLDLSNFGLGVGEPLRLWFDLAYGKRNNQTDDLLVISYSKDCGQTWQVRASWDTDELVTTSEDNVGNNFIPSSSEWMEKSVNIQAAAEQNDVIIRFDFSGDRGSYLYIDNVRLEGEWISVHEQSINPKNYIVKKIDLLGRENCTSKFYLEIYNNGNVVKKYEY
tara:strand:- start:45 stop:1976 length:1932 start_codon:yes stop_codon:yes gene_type:complete